MLSVFSRSLENLFKNEFKIQKLFNLQQASRSSAPSKQSLSPSQSLLFSIHFGALFGPPFGQLNLLSGQVIAVQFFSSVPSVQSL